MSTQHNIQSKTVGRQTAGLLVGLYDRSQSTFTLADAREITGLSSHPSLAVLIYNFAGMLFQNQVELAWAAAFGEQPAGTRPCAAALSRA